MWIVLAGLAIAAAPRDPPAGWCDLATIPGVRLAIGYATPQNFTGAILPGYAAPGAWLRCPAAESLARVQAALAARGYGLLVYDAYRPVRASLAMVAWAGRAGRMDVINDGFVAPKSGHNRGATIDLSVYDVATGAALDMGTPWDTFDAAAATANATGVVAENRQRLVAAMGAEGWKNYSKEWWHFSLAGQSGDALDVPYGRCEPDTFTSVWSVTACP